MAGAYRPHHALGYVIFIVAVLTSGVAALAKVPGRLVAMPAIVAALVGVQVVIADVAKGLGDGSTAGPLVFGLHAVNGVAILVLSGMVARPARALARPAPGAAN